MLMIERMSLISTSSMFGASVICNLGVANTGPPVSSVKTATTSSSSITSSSSGNPRILKTGMIMKKQTVTEMKGVRDDIEEEDSEESYYR